MDGDQDHAVWARRLLGEWGTVCLLNATGRTVELNLLPESYAEFRKVVRARFEVSVPVKGSETFLRIGVHDIPSNRFGVVEIPVASIAKLPPPPDAPTAATPKQPVTPTPATNAPTTTPEAKPNTKP